jgi:hypothetical protein
LAHSTEGLPFQVDQFLGSSSFGIFLTPVFFYVIQGFGGVKQEGARPEMSKYPPAVEEG